MVTTPHSGGETDADLQELLTGASLRDMVSTERSKTLDEWLLLAAEIADALATAHRAGIVHRDHIVHARAGINERSGPDRFS